MLENDDTMAQVTEEPARLYRFKLGSRFAGRYDIEALLGEGGMGAVYRVRDVALAETVALKVLTLPSGGKRDAAQMFRQEVKLSRRITHANVVHVYDFGEVDSILYMTMELVDGITLRRAMYNVGGKLPLTETVRVAHALANGLAAVHAQGIVHRDLKPGNVMIAKTGRVVLADFGIASHVESDDPATRGRIIGTISYMAPEQFAKQAPTFRTDLYSFGLVVLECLTGALPPRCEGWLSAHRKPIPVDLCAAGVVGKSPDIAAVEKLLRRCLDNNPEMRPASAEEVSRDLNALLPRQSSLVEIGTHSVDRTRVSVVRGAQLPRVGGAEALMDRTTSEIAEYVAQGVPDDVAHDYVTARHESRMSDAGHLVRSFERLDECVRRAPQFQQAIATRAILAVRCWFFDRTANNDVDWEGLATDCVDHAMVHAPNLSDTHLAMAMLVTQRLEIKHATRSLIRAVEINPASHEAQEYLGGIEIETGLVACGISRLVYASTALPLRPMPCLILARCYALIGRFDEAEAQIADYQRRASIPTLGGLLYALRLHAYRHGKQPFALSISQRKAIRDNDWIGVTHYVAGLAGTADPNTVSAWIDRVVPSLNNPRVRMVMHQICCELFILLGLETKAMASLADCARDGLIDILWVDRCPLLTPLRTMDGFGEIRDWVWLNAYGVWN